MGHRSKLFDDNIWLRMGSDTPQHSKPARLWVRDYLTTIRDYAHGPHCARAAYLVGAPTMDCSAPTGEGIQQIWMVEDAWFFRGHGRLHDVRGEQT